MVLSYGASIVGGRKVSSNADAMLLSRIKKFQPRVPVKVNVDLWIKSGAEINAHIDLRDFPRLDGLVSSIESGIVALNLHQDNFGLGIVRGLVAGRFTSPCARCLQPKVFEIKEQIAWKLTNTKGSSLTNSCELETLEISNSTLFLRSTIEDQIILCVPIMVSHDDCQMFKNSIGKLESSCSKMEKQNKFAELLKLKIFK